MRQLTTKVGLVLATTAGCSPSGSGLPSQIGTVSDPLPPPLVCSELARPGVAHGRAEAAPKDGAYELAFSLSWENTWGASVEDISITEVVGGTVTSAPVFDGSGDGAGISFTLEVPALPATGKFRVQAKATSSGGGDPCTIDQRFSFSVDVGGHVAVTAGAESAMPLRLNRGTRVAILDRRDDGTYRLEGRSAVRGCRFEWACTGGEFVSSAAGTVDWRPPAEKGLYQVQLIAESDEGLAFDTLEVEVA